MQRRDFITLLGGAAAAWPLAASAQQPVAVRIDTLRLHGMPSLFLRRQEFRFHLGLVLRTMQRAQASKGEST